MQNSIQHKTSLTIGIPLKTAGQTTREFAAAIGFHPESVRRCIRQGRVKATRFGKTWRIPPDEVNRVLAQGLPGGMQ